MYCRKTKDSTAKLTQLKRNQQTEKKNSAQMLEEARQRENQMTEDMTKLQVQPSYFSRRRVRYHFMTRIFSSEFYRYAKLVFQVICRSVQDAASNFLHRTDVQLVLT